VRWQLVGFTSATYTGAMGGHFGVTQKCQSEFPNSRMCSLEEVAATTSIPSSLAGDAWAHNTTDTGGAESPVIFAARVLPASTSCNGWRSASPANVRVVNADGGRGNEVACESAHAIACCALVP